MGIGVALQATLPLAGVRAARHIKSAAADWTKGLLSVFSSRSNSNGERQQLFCRTVRAKNIRGLLLFPKISQLKMHVELFPLGRGISAMF